MTSIADDLASSSNVSAIMRNVIYALIPGSVIMIGFFGFGVLINILLSISFALILEGLFLKLRNRPVKESLTDFSAVLTAWIFALTLPPLTPWWLTLTGIFFAIVIAKQLYGGLGSNLFNPAMVGFVVLLISWPAYMTTWFAPAGLGSQSPGFMDSLIYILTGSFPASLNWDSLTMATPLDTLKTQIKLNHTLSEIRVEPIFGTLAGYGGEWIASGFALGGLWLISKRIISWQLPVAMLVTLGTLAAIFSINQPDIYAPPTFHILTPGVMLGAFFLITDPVTSCSSMRGRIVIAVGVGVLVYIIRTWGGYPGSIAFSVLLMNMAAPAIDYFIKPRVYGH